MSERARNMNGTGRTGGQSGIGANGTVHANTTTSMSAGGRTGIDDRTAAGADHTAAYTGAETPSGDENRIDFGTLFPAKGDPRRPPEWFSRALMYVAIAIVVFSFCWRSWGSISYLVLDVIISLFLALAIEPLVVALVSHGWKRGVASAVGLVGLAVIIGVLLTLFGNMFVQQMIAMVKGLPAMYEQLREFLQPYSKFQLPEIDSLGTEIFNNIQTSWVTDFAGTAMSTVGGLFSFLLDLMTVIMTTYYISAAGPKLRRSFCQWLAPNTQRRFLLVWTVAQGQISSFLFSRSILAMINATCTAIFLEVLKVPYWLPLALFCGVVSQFIPTVGTYIGGALPVLFAWGNRGWVYAVAVLAFIIIYQQIENLILSPKISQRTMDINAAVAFLAVLAFGSLFGAFGAFLALPVVASIQAIFRVYTRRYELIDSPLMNDPVSDKKSKIVEASEAFGEHVLHPIGEHMPRAAKGSSSRVPMNEELRLLQEQIYAIPEREDTQRDMDDSATVAIPKNVLSVGVRKGLRGTEEGDVPDGTVAGSPERSEGSRPSGRANVGAYDAAADAEDTEGIPQPMHLEHGAGKPDKTSGGSGTSRKPRRSDDSGDTDGSDQPAPASGSAQSGGDGASKTPDQSISSNISSNPRAGWR
ncbi:AI-2E family transporter [Bifidobacterium callitrichidarum]|uniref:AI-2E family transporter n=1 Tax=Bifidobacterium callitrichidarum TaxID=2052941 RepID=UPI003BA991A5